MKKSFVLFMLAMTSICAMAGGFDTARRDAILKEISGARIPERQQLITRFGGKGDGRTDCLPAFGRRTANRRSRW